MGLCRASGCHRDFTIWLRMLTAHFVRTISHAFNVNLRANHARAPRKIASNAHQKAQCGYPHCAMWIPTLHANAMCNCPCAHSDTRKRNVDTHIASNCILANAAIVEDGEQCSRKRCNCGRRRATHTRRRNVDTHIAQCGYPHCMQMQCVIVRVRILIPESAMWVPTLQAIALSQTLQLWKTASNANAMCNCPCVYCAFSVAFGNVVYTTLTTHHITPPTLPPTHTPTHTPSPPPLCKREVNTNLRTCTSSIQSAHQRYAAMFAMFSSSPNNSWKIASPIQRRGRQPLWM
jgi:hypothetical protein